MHGFTFRLDDELTEGNSVALTVVLPDGRSLQIWAETFLHDRAVTLRQFAIYGHDVLPQKLGAGLLLQLAQAVMEEFDVDSIRIEEARRTSGANPNRTLKTIEIRRR